jgi:hypothetical protein
MPFAYVLGVRIVGRLLPRWREVMTGNTDREPVEANLASSMAAAPSSVERREALRRFGVYATVTAPAMTVLLASRQSAAGSFFANGDAHRRGKSGLGGGGKPISGGGGGGGGGGCGFSC